jgi:hypothetical protein
MMMGRGVARQAIENSTALFRRNGISIAFRTLAEEVLSPLQKSGQIRTENLHANRYTLAGAESSAAADDDEGGGTASPLKQGRAKANAKAKEPAVDEVMWRRAVEGCLELGSPEARIWRMLGGGSDQPSPLSVEELNVLLCASLLACAAACSRL